MMIPPCGSKTRPQTLLDYPNVLQGNMKQIQPPAGPNRAILILPGLQGPNALFRAEPGKRAQSPAVILPVRDRLGAIRALPMT
jgi:hypothetical protein